MLHTVHNVTQYTYVPGPSHIQVRCIGRYGILEGIIGHWAWQRSSRKRDQTLSPSPRTLHAVVIRAVRGFAVRMRIWIDARPETRSHPQRQRISSARQFVVDSESIWAVCRLSSGWPVFASSQKSTLSLFALHPSSQPSTLRNSPKSSARLSSSAVSDSSAAGGAPSIRTLSAQLPAQTRCSGRPTRRCPAFSLSPCSHQPTWRWHSSARKPGENTLKLHRLAHHRIAGCILSSLLFSAPEKPLFWPRWLSPSSLPGAQLPATTRGRCTSTARRSSLRR